MVGVTAAPTLVAPSPMATVMVTAMATIMVAVMAVEPLVLVSDRSLMRSHTTLTHARSVSTQ